MRSTLLQGWNWAAIKGESVGVTRIVVKKLRFVYFMASTKTKKAMATVASNVSKVADSISVLDSFLTTRFMLSQTCLWIEFGSFLRNC